MAVSSEAKEFINSMSAHMLDVSPGLAGASERGSPECGDRINVTSSKWLLDEDQQYIFDSIMQMEQEFIGEVRAVGGGDQMTVSKIPRVRAGIARKAAYGPEKDVRLRGTESWLPPPPATGVKHDSKQGTDPGPK